MKKINIGEIRKVIKEIIKEEIGGEKYLTREDIIRGIEMLARSQGSYGRMLTNLRELEENDPERYDTVMQELEGARFKDIVDFVMYIES